MGEQRIIGRDPAPKAIRVYFIRPGDRRVLTAAQHRAIADRSADPPTAAPGPSS